MRLRHLAVLTVAVCAIGTAYIASPFVSAWSLREAVKRGDTAAIESKVTWPTVRQTLRDSLANHANLLPMANAAGAEVRPSIWQRVKSAFGATMLDRFIETYVTAEGLPKLFDYKRMWNETVPGAAVAEVEPASRLERFKLFWARIHRAEFQSLTKVEMEIADRKMPDRHFVSVMELDGFGWKLTGLRVITVDPAKRLTELEGRAAEVR
jgi:hypothetical protein